MAAAVSALELLKSLVSIPSVNPFQYFHRPDGSVVGLGSEETINIFLEQYLRESGFDVSRQNLHGHEQLEVSGARREVPARWNVLAVRYPKNWNGKSILLFGHTDTVDVKKGWQTDPFSVAVKKIDGKDLWFGLGVNDMKGGLAAILDAAKHTQSQSYAIKIALVVDEEFYSFGADALCNSEFLNDVVLAIAPEIGDAGECDDVLSANHQVIGIGRTGRVEFDVHITGKACHGADAFISKEMVNATHESVKLQAALIEYFAEIRRSFSKDGARSINSAYISYHTGGEPMLSVPDHASFVIDRTFLPDESPDDELMRLRALISDLQRSGKVDGRALIEMAPRPRPTPPCKAYAVRLDLPEIKTLLHAVEKHSRAHSYYIGRSVADENRIAARGIPTLTLGPTGAGSHTAHEWVDPQSVIRANEIFKSFIASL